MEEWRDYASPPKKSRSNNPSSNSPSSNNHKSEKPIQLISNPASNVVSHHLAYPEGQMQVDSSFYIERPPIEQRCYEEISRPGSLIRIKAPRQMGKSSLLARILHQAEQQGDKTVYLSLQVAATKCFSDVDTFLKWFCASVARALHLAPNLDECWDLAEIMGGKSVLSRLF